MENTEKPLCKYYEESLYTNLAISASNDETGGFNLWYLRMNASLSNSQISR